MIILTGDAFQADDCNIAKFVKLITNCTCTPRVITLSVITLSGTNGTSNFEI